MVESMVRCGQFALIVIDSVASLTPKKEIDGDMEAQQVGTHAKLMSHACRKLVPLVNDSKTIVIFINQIRMNIGVVFPGQSPEFTTGGKALKFYSSVRLDIRRIAQIKKGDEVVGGRTRVKVVKNKVAPPYKQTEFDIMYGEGISKQGEVLALGEKFNIINREGQSFIFGDIKLGRGYDASRIFLKDNPKIMDEIVEKIKEAFKKPTEHVAELEDNNLTPEE